MAASEGTTTTRVNLRGGPGTDSQVLRVLEPGMPVLILEDTGTWLRVEAGGQQGFVHERFVKQQSQAVPPGFVAHQPEPFPNLPLEPPADLQIKVPPGATAGEKLVARTWNRAGNLLALLSQHLKIDPGAGVAVFCVESGGKGFGPGGRMLIRFENHHFFRHWGKANRGLKTHPRKVIALQRQDFHPLRGAVQRRRQCRCLQREDRRYVQDLPAPPSGKRSCCS